MKVICVRAYLSERDNIEPIMQYLHEEAKVRGVTVFRGVSGFGSSGVMHEAHLVDLQSDLPLVVEFFDEPDKIAAVVAHLSTLFDTGHLLHWPAEVLP